MVWSSVLFIGFVRLVVFVPKLLLEISFLSVSELDTIIFKPLTLLLIAD